MTALTSLTKALLRRLWRFARKVLTVIVRPPTRLLISLSQRTALGVPTAMQRHRERVSSDHAYASQIGAALTALASTLIERPPYSSLAVVLLSAWLGTAASDAGALSYPERTSLTARVREQQEGSPSKDPVPIWDRYPFE